MSTKDLNVLEDKLSEAANVDSVQRSLMYFGGRRIDFREYRKLETLPREAWERIDETLIRTAKEDLVGIADLRANPQTRILIDGMAQSIFTRKRLGEVGPANVNVNPDTSSDAGIQVLDQISVPMVVTYKDFKINTSEMAMAARAGLPLGLSLVEESTRSVARRLESDLFVGQNTANGATSYGYTKFPDRQEYDIATGWNTAAPDDIMKDVNNMIQLSINAHYNGPWMLYVARNWISRLNEDYTAGVGYPVAGSIYNRLMQLRGLIDIKMAEYIPSSNVVLVQMNSQSVQLIEGMPIRAIAWEPPGTPNWEHRFKVMTITVPMLISDKLGQCGIIHGWQIP